MSLVLNESLVLAKTRTQDLKSVIKLNCWGSGIEDVSLVRQMVNVEVIGLSCNEITTLEDFAYCPKLRELILRKNKIKNISEVVHLQKLPKLTCLWLGENPCAETTHNYRKVVLKALPNLTVLDNQPVTREELQEIEELGNEIYEEIPYESSNSSGSGPNSTSCQNQTVASKAQSIEQNSGLVDETVYSNVSNHDRAFINETSFYQPVENHDISGNVGQVQNNDLQYAPSNNNRISQGSAPRAAISTSQSRSFSSQSSVTTLGGQQCWMGSNNNNNNNNNNNVLPKGGKSRKGNILSAVLCLVNELDYDSCEVVQTALHCRMEKTHE